MNQPQIEIIQAWARSQGVAKVKQKTIEELAELIRGISRGDLHNIIEEIADTRIMLMQLECVLKHEEDLFPERVVSEIARKVARIEMMLAEKYDNPMEHRQKIERVGLNVGHGHVFPRADGLRAMCEGPPMCSECSKDQERKIEVEAILSDEVAG